MLDDDIWSSSSRVPTSRDYDYEHRFAEHEHDFARSIDALSSVGKTAGPTKTARFGHRLWSRRVATAAEHLNQGDWKS